MKLKKHWTLPGALLAFGIIMAVYGYILNGYRLPDDFVSYAIVEAVIVIALHFLLRWKEKIRRKY